MYIRHNRYKYLMEALKMNFPYTSKYRQKNRCLKLKSSFSNNNNLRCWLQRLMIFSRNVFWGATNPLLPPGITTIPKIKEGGVTIYSHLIARKVLVTNPGLICSTINDVEICNCCCCVKRLILKVKECNVPQQASSRTND